MGKKSKRNKNKHITDPEYPFVSICTPTFNRRPFIPEIIKCVQLQDYPSDRIEWLIYDDGTDKIEDLVSNIQNVKYFKSNCKISLGSKRNFLHKKSKGDILVYMDDDDYYPPSRVSHAVETLKANPSALIAGSSEIYIYFKHINAMYQFGPYGDAHATAGTFAIRKSYIQNNKYDPQAAIAEEKYFLKNYTAPLVQLDPLKTILVFSHPHNTYDKKQLLDQPSPYQKVSDKTIDMFIKDPSTREFFINTMPDLLNKYNPGAPSMKPDVMEQIEHLKQKRKKDKEKQLLQQEASSIIEITDADGHTKHLNISQVVQMLQYQQKTIQQSNETIKHLKLELTALRENSYNKDNFIHNQLPTCNDT